MQRQGKIKLLFLCTGNSCRSQMAEGWTRELKGGEIEVYSAGVETHGLNPLAVQVMAESGVDISKHRSQHISEFLDHELDYVVTVCDHAHESCPLFPGKTKLIHVGFADPPLLAEEVLAQGGGQEAVLSCYRGVRDEIKAYVDTLPDSLID